MKKKYKPKVYIKSPKYIKETAKTKRKVAHPIDVFNVNSFNEDKRVINRDIKSVNRNVNKRLTAKDKKVLIWADNAIRNKRDSLHVHDTPRRLVLRRKLVKKALGGKSRIDKPDPDLYLTGGIGGSGKSYGAERIIAENEGVKNYKDAVTTVNPDEFKGVLMKYEKGNKNYKKSKKYKLLNAQYFHEESTCLADEQYDVALKEKRDILLDKTQSSKHGIIKKIKKAKKAGYDVHEIGVFVKPRVAIRRSTDRFFKSGRYLPPSIIRDKYKKSHKNILGISKNYVDTFVLLDASPGDKNAKMAKKNKNAWVDGENYYDYKYPAAVGRNTKHARVLKPYRDLI